MVPSTILAYTMDELKEGLFYYVQIGGFNLLNLTIFTVSMSILLAALIRYAMSRPRQVFIVDFSCCKPTDGQKSTREFLLKQAISTKRYDDDSLTFMRKVAERSGIGPETYIPMGGTHTPMITTLESATSEAKQAIFGAVDELLAKTGVRPEEIGILVSNCGLYCPAPSITAMVVNQYKLNENIVSYNLGGMGCSAGLISIDLAKRFLQVHRNTYALVVSTENLTLNGYYGNYRPMLVTNSIFRMGGAAVLLSNRPADHTRSKYQLVHTVRTNKGADDRFYGCVVQEEDDKGNLGIALSKDLMAVAGDSLRTNITTLGPLVLPMSEKLKFLISLIKRKVLKMDMQPYMPDFKRAFEHFCIHAGGRAVLDEIEKSMSLNEWHMEPSRMTLWRWGNTSSSSLWYELAYMEAKGRIGKGDRVWQIAFGSGFKCNSAVWKAVRDVVPAEERNPWLEEIEKFPVVVPNIDNIIDPRSLQ